MYRSGALKPFIVLELLVVMLLAGVGTAFAVEPDVVAPTPTPTPTSSPTPAPGFLRPDLESDPELVPNPELTQYIAVRVTVENTDTARAHSGIVYVAIEWEGETFSGQGSVTSLAAGTSIQVTVNLGEPMMIGNEGAYYKAMRVMVTQTS